MSLPQPIRLIDSPRAPNPRRVRMFIAEKGITLPTTDLDIMQGEHFREEYRGKAGTHHVPALELVGGTVLTETVAICRYLEALYPEPNLMGVDPLEQAVVEMWSRRMEFGLLLPVAQVLRHGNPAMEVLESPQVPEWAEVNRPRVQRGLEMLEVALAETPFIAGERFTIADITAIVSVEFMRTIRMSVPEEHVGTHAWMDGIRQRPGYVK
ncbi:MAG: glutathione S-transferase family protein [Rubricella sp.]